MGLFDKLPKAITTSAEKENYDKLLSAARISITNLGCSPEDGILVITGTVPDGPTALNYLLFDIVQNQHFT